jgi:hypothetical protein
VVAVEEEEEEEEVVEEETMNTKSKSVNQSLDHHEAPTTQRKRWLESANVLGEDGNRGRGRDDGRGCPLLGLPRRLSNCFVQLHSVRKRAAAMPRP